MQRLVLAAPTSLLDEIGTFEGYTREVGRYERLFAEAVFIPRDSAERDPAFKQLIPYVVLKHGSKVFSYVRGAESSEGRLVARRSIGLGGHIEPLDDSLFRSPSQIYGEAAKREVAEEVTVESPYEEQIIGLINDNSDEVGRVHLAVVHLWNLTEPAVRKKERQITEAGFREMGALRDEPEELEAWSRIALRLLAQASPPT